MSLLSKLRSASASASKGSNTVSSFAIIVRGNEGIRLDVFTSFIVPPWRATVVCAPIRRPPRGATVEAESPLLD